MTHLPLRGALGPLTMPRPPVAAEPQLTPAEVSGLEFWLRADTGLFTTSGGSTPAGIGDPVGRWEDQSGNALHVTQAVNGQRPTLVTTGFKSQPGVQFVPASTQFLRSATFQKTSAATAGTWFLCVRTSGSGTSPVMAPSSDALGWHDDNGSAIFYHHSGAAEYGFHSFYRPNVGKLIMATFNGAGIGNAGRLSQRANKVARTLTYSTTIESTAYAVGASLNVGKHWVAPVYMDGEILEAAFWRRALTVPEVEGLEAYAKARYFSKSTGFVHCVGDSLTKGYPDHTSDGLDWPTKLGVLLGGSWGVLNSSIVAFTIAQLANTAEAVTTPVRDEWFDVVNGGLGNIVIHQGGTNNLYPATGNQSAATAIAEMVSEVTKRHLRGYQVLVVTIPPFGPQADLTAQQEADFETQRLLYNASVRNGDTGADGIVDWAADARLSDPTNATYFYSGDQLHLTAGGNDVAAELAKAAMEAL